MYIEHLHTFSLWMFSLRKDIIGLNWLQNTIKKITLLFGKLSVQMMRWPANIIWSVFTFKKTYISWVVCHKIDIKYVFINWPKQESNRVRMSLFYHQHIDHVQIKFPNKQSLLWCLFDIFRPVRKMKFALELQSSQQRFQAAGQSPWHQLIAFSDGQRMWSVVHPMTLCHISLGWRTVDSPSFKDDQ